jgi:predicted integral membrane protein DUF2269
VSLYTLALIAHILGALGMFIGMGLQWAVVFRLRLARTVDQVREWSGLSRIAGRSGPVSGVLILAAGIYMTVTSWSLTTPWIVVSLVAMLLMIGIGMGVTARRLRAIRRATLAGEADGAAISPDVARLIQEPVLWVSAQMTVGIAVGIVFLMTNKPGLVASLVAMAVALGLGLIAGLATVRNRQRSQGSAAPQRVGSIG